MAVIVRPPILFGFSILLKSVLHVFIDWFGLISRILEWLLSDSYKYSSSLMY